MQEMKELQRDPSSDYMAAAIEVSVPVWVPSSKPDVLCLSLLKLLPTLPFDLQSSLMPVQDNIFEWHFAVKGSVDTEFQVRAPRH